MPYIDERTGHLVIRIVYDGAAEAGKTTNIAALASAMPLQRRSELVSPKSRQRRTEFFDWVTFTGGYVDGRRLRCQLVSVPGQPSLLRRRRYVLDTADAVVYVADSRPHAVKANRRGFSMLRRAVVRRGGAVPATVLLQANKQDLPESLAPADLAEALGAEGIEVYAAEAAHGVGVLSTFVAAARLGTQRVKDLIASGWSAVAAADSTPQSLLAELEALERELSIDARPVPIVPRPSELPPPGSARPPLPGSEHASEAHIWPLVEGRVVFSELAGGRVTWSAAPVPWAPPEAVQAQVEDRGEVRWLMHSCPKWTFDDAAEAKQALISLVRRQRALEPFLPPGRALSLHHDGTSHRIWMVTEALPTLADPSIDPPPAALAELVAAKGPTRLRGPARAAVGLRDGRVYVLALPDDDAGARLLDVTGT